MTVTEIIEDVKEHVCRDICKYTDTWDEEKEGCEICESDYCRNCPLNNL